MQQVLFFILAIVLRVTADGFEEEETKEKPSTHVPRLLSTEIAVEATVGENVQFPCDVEDIGDYVLLWKHKTNNILFAGDLRIVRDDRIRLNQTTLLVNNIQSKDSGEYTCTISTNPTLELSHSLDVFYPPTVSAQPKSAFITAKEGESVTLTCDATGNPKPKMTWKHAGRNYEALEDDNFVISNAQKNHSGEYECIADNRIGEPASAVITVEIVSAPKIVLEPKSGLLVVKEGEPISIACRASGDPAPIITWKKPEPQSKSRKYPWMMDNAERMMKMHTGEKVMIDQASLSHAGSYECIANNSLGISTSAVIRVQVLYAPKVQISESSIHAREGASVSLTCVAEGEPAPTVTWKKEGAVIHSSEHHHIKVHGNSHMLIIRHIQEKDFGLYECIASNSLSSASGSTLLIGTPQVPSFTSKPHGSQGTKYTISWTVHPQTPIDEFSLMYRKKESEEWISRSVPAELMNDDDKHTQMFQLVDLEPATTYEAVVKARNKFGWSEQSEALVFTTRNEEKQSQNYSSSSCIINYSLWTMFFLIISNRFLH